MFKPWLKPEVETKPQLDEVGQCLMDAAQRIRERGHAKGALVRTNGSVCAVGAIHNCTPANEGGSDNSVASCRATASLTKHLGIDNLPSWNNAPERTAAEVIAALESAALTRAINLRDAGK